MTKIHNEMLSKNPYVELTEGADDICENCPNNENGICTQENQFQVMIDAHTKQ